MNATIDQHAYRLVHMLVWSPTDHDFAIAREALISILIDYEDDQPASSLILQAALEREPQERKP